MEGIAGGKASKIKGDKFERDIVKMFGGERTFWQPENTDDKRSGDVVNIPYIGTVECKARKSGFKQIYDWLTGCDGLFIKADYKPILAIIPADDLKLLIEELDELKVYVGKNISGCCKECKHED